MMKNKCFSILILLSVLCFTFTKLSFAQLIFEDAKGEEVLIQYWGSAVIFNTANNSIKLGYTVQNGEDWVLGFDVSGKATNGVASLLKNGNLNAGFKINFSIGYTFSRAKWEEVNEVILKREHEKKGEEIKRINDKYKTPHDELEKEIKKLEEKRLELEKGKMVDVESDEQSKQRTPLLERKIKKFILEREKEDLQRKKENDRAELDKKYEEIIRKDLEEKLPRQLYWLNFRFGYEKAEFKIFSPEASIENQITNEVFNGLSARISLNRYFNEYNTLVSLSVGINRTNNASLLKKVELTDETVYGTSVENITRSSKKTFNARQGTFETFNLGYILLSSFWKPSKLPFGIIAYGRYNYSRLIRSLNLGTGIYILKSKERSLVPLGGIMVEYEDKFDSEMNDISFGDRITVNLVVSLPLFMKK